MRRFTGAEKGILVLAVLFIIVGADMTICPTEMNLSHQAYRWTRSSSEHISKVGSMFYGIVMILLGAGIVWLVFRGRSK